MLYQTIQSTTTVKARFGDLSVFDVVLECHKPQGGGQWYEVKLVSGGRIVTGNRNDIRKGLKVNRNKSAVVKTHCLEHARKVYSEYVAFSFE